MDDFGDFEGFTEFTNGGPANAAPNVTKGADLVGGMENFSFPAFPDISGQDGGQGDQDFADFTQFGGAGENIHIAGGVPFEIPPLPLSPDPENVHLAGGVPFDIPPLPFDDMEIMNSIPPPSSEDMFLGGTASNGSSTGLEVDSRTQGVASGLMDSSLLPKQSEASNIDSQNPNSTLSATNEGQSSWNADFGSTFSGPGTNSSGNGTNEVGVLSMVGEVGQFGGISEVNPASSGGDDFGEFGAFSGSLDATSASMSAEGTKSVPPVTTTAGFGDFTGVSSTVGGPRTSAVDSEAKEGDDFGEFGGFSSNPVVAPPTESGEPAKSDDFGDFGAFSTNPEVATATGSGGDSKGGADFEELGGFSLNPVVATTTAETSNATNSKEIGEFGGFPSNPAPDGEKDEFGDFGAFSSGPMKVPVESNTGGSEFGNFASTGPTKDEDTKGSEDFGGFEAFTADFSSNPVTSSAVASTSQGKPEDDFGDFGGFSAAPDTSEDNFGGFTAAPDKSGDDFGGFSAAPEKSGDDFGGFSAAPEKSGDDFGGFAAFSSGSEEKSLNFGSFSSSAQESVAPSVGITSESASATMTECLALSEDSPPPSSCPSPLANLVTLATSAATASKSETNNTPTISVWLVLQKCIDLTVPLHKFDKSFLQNCYYSALAVDPMLISRPSTLSILTGKTQFEDPLGGATAVEDLRESFGFEGILAQPGSPIEANTTALFRQQSADPGAAALLDLSLPLSPNSPTRDSFTLTADLAGLDLNPKASQDKKLTSIQELLLNERLVVNRSTWMDSQLASLEGEGGGGEGGAGNASSQPSTPQSLKKGASSMEFQLEQLGLDASKTTSVRGGSRELSLSARSVLGRIPDLSFMLLQDSLEKTTLYFRTHS